MDDSQHDIGQVKAFKAEAIGGPGKRTFRLLVDGSKGGACLWLEKEQLYSLATSIQRMLDATPPERGAASSQTGKVSDEEYLALEFKIGRMGMGYDEENDQFVFLIHDVDVLTEALEEAAEAAEEAGEDAEDGEEDLEEEDSLEEALSNIEPTLSFKANRPALADMCQQAEEVCMGGRPICPLCSQPIDPKGHICPRTNGHHPPEARRAG